MDDSHFFTARILFIFCILTAASCSDNGNSGGIGNTGLLNDAPSLEMNEDSYLLAVTDKEVYRVSAQTGATDVVFASESTDPWGFLSPADVVDDIAIISATDRTLNAISLTTGSFLWELPVGGGIGDYPSVPTCSNRECFVIGVSTFSDRWIHKHPLFGEPHRST